MSDTTRSRPVPHAASRNKLLRALRADGTTDGPIAPRVARLFGGVYEDLLGDYFRSQRTTGKSAPTWRDAGKAWRVGDTKRIPQDFLVTRVHDAISDDDRDRLTVFEAKSWPGYQNFSQINLGNIEAFLDETNEFVKHTAKKSTKWVRQRPDDAAAPEPFVPKSFGFLVFDYDHDQRGELIAAMQKRSEKLVELESIVDLLSMVLYNGVTEERRARLTEERDAAARLFSVLLGE